MNKHLAPFSVIALCIAGFGSPAKADIVSVTVTGTVASGSDGSGLFGTAGADLTSEAYTAQYEFDTSLGNITSNPYTSEASGGSDFNVTSPSLGASLTINGQSFSIAGTYYSYIYGANNGGSYSESDAVVENAADFYLQNIMYGFPGTSPVSITTSFSIDSTDNTTVGAFNDGGGTFLNLLPTIYTEIDPAVSSVPEPASMALLGIGMIGTVFVARRRRNQSALFLTGTGNTGEA